MGFRSGLRGGGLFNGDGTLRQFVFSAIAPGDKKAGEWAYVVLAFQPDGSEKVNTQHLFLGGADQYEFEEGGTEAFGVDNKTGERKEKSSIGRKTPSGLFFQTLYEAGDKAGVDFDTVLPDLDAGEALDFTGLEGVRVALAQEVDVKATKNLGKRKGSDGNEYDRTNTIVESVYELPEAEAAAKPAARGRSAAAANGVKAGGKGSKKAEDTTVRDAADAVVLQLIADAKKADKKNKTGETPISKFKMAVLRSADIDKGIKADVTKLLADQTYLTEAVEREVFSYDVDGETVEEA